MARGKSPFLAIWEKLSSLDFGDSLCFSLIWRPFSRGKHHLRVKVSDARARFLSSRPDIQGKHRGDGSCPRSVDPEPLSSLGCLVWSGSSVVRSLRPRSFRVHFFERGKEFCHGEMQSDLLKSFEQFSRHKEPRARFETMGFFAGR